MTRSRRDDGLRQRLEGVEAHPVLIMGLHRSGTTWLYETLASLLPVATLSVYDIVHYGELLAAHEDGTEKQLQAAIDARFGDARTRGFDDIALSHATLDEYGFVLRRDAGRALVDAKTLPTFNELVRKLAFIQGHPTVLLKNPWDTRQGAFIAAHVPDARFIFLRRDPAKIVDSQVRMIDGFLAGENALLELLQEGMQPETAIFGGLRRTRRLIGEARLLGWLASRVERHVCSEMAHYRRALGQIAPDRRVEVEYESLVAAPGTALEPVVSLIGLAPERPLSSVVGKPRATPLLPEVAARAESIRAAVGE